MERNGLESWRLFLATGLPEAYLLAKKQEREERHAPRDKGHRPERDGLQGIR